jgi:hypothetical protein
MEKSDRPRRRRNDMKVELKDAKVELEVVGGKATLFINGQGTPITQDVGVALIFGDNVRYVPPKLIPTVEQFAKSARPGIVKAERKSGAQSAASRKKLSESLRAYHAKKKKQKTPTKKGHLNGSSLHVN